MFVLGVVYGGCISALPDYWLEWMVVCRYFQSRDQFGFMDLVRLLFAT